MDLMRIERDIDRIRARIVPNVGLASLPPLLGLLLTPVAHLIGLIGLGSAVGLAAVLVGGIAWVNRWSVTLTLNAKALVVERHAFGRLLDSRVLPLDGIRQVRASNEGLFVSMLDRTEVNVERGGYGDLVVLQDLIQARLVVVQPAEIEELEPPKALQDMRQRDG